VNLVQIDDSQCKTCHTPQGELEFDASILGGHTIPTNSRDLPGTVFKLISVQNGTAGSAPTVTFSLKDKSGKPILPSQMNRLAIVLAGPTSDYSTQFSEDATKAPASTDGTVTYTFTNKVPVDAVGSFTVGIEGYRNITLLPGTVQSQVVRDAGINQTMSFSVDGSKMAPRRKIVDIAKCNVCHTALAPHGGNRNQVDQCVMCHNPTGTDAPVRPAAKGPNQGINFAMMIHKIHRGDNLTTDFTIFGFGGAPINFNDVRFPGDLRDCATCHVNGSEQLPIKATMNITDPRGPIPSVGATTSACTGCHDTISTASHALSNTTMLGEACATCHGPSADFSVDKVHAK
jgi:OmcA/MtrC family decaheme c-type cytochrome